MTWLIFLLQILVLELVRLQLGFQLLGLGQFIALLTLLLLADDGLCDTRGGAR